MNASDELRDCHEDLAEMRRGIVQLKRIAQSSIRVSFVLGAFVGVVGGFAVGKWASGRNAGEEKSA
jgi:hypothetical protein